MLERSLYRRVIRTRSAGRGRTITIYWSPLNLRHELDFKGQTIMVFAGSRDLSLIAAIGEADRMTAELKGGDADRLNSR